MPDRDWKDRDRFDRATEVDRDSPPRAGEDVRNDNVDRPYPDPDYSGISYGSTGGHAEDRSVHRREAKCAAEDVAEDIPKVRDVHNHLRLVKGQGVGRTSVLGLTESQTQRNSKLAPISTGSLRRRSAGGGTRRSRTRT